jgi:nitrogen PTS system EIIA component
MKLSVRDVAKLLDVSEKTVYRWLTERKLPAYRLHGQYRFNRAEVLTWATAEKLNVPLNALQESDNADLPLPTLEDALHVGGIYYRLGGLDKESVLREAVEVLRLPDEVDREFLLQVMLARERMTSTAIGDGVAIPHARNPIVLHVDKPLISLCFLEKPIDFGALDGQPVHVLFILVSPTVRAHLHLLYRLSFALRDEEFKILLREEAGRDALLYCIRRISASLPNPPGMQSGIQKPGPEQVAAIHAGLPRTGEVRP